MSELAFHSHAIQPTDFGQWETGVVHRVGHDIPVLVAEPSGFNSDADPTIILSHGFTATADMYRLPAAAWAQQGWRVILPTFDRHTLVDLAHPIRACAEDVEAVAGQYGLESDRYRLVGHSMGTVVNILAAGHMPKPDALVQVNPAMLCGKYSQVRHGQEMANELRDSFSDDDPEWRSLIRLHASRLAELGTLMTVVSQLGCLMRGSVLRRYAEVAAAVPVVAMVTPGDGITPAAETHRELATIEGIHVRELGPLSGFSGHLSFCRDPGMARRIGVIVDEVVQVRRAA